jgi:hypothetical protein
MDYCGIDINPEYVETFALPNLAEADTGVPVAEQQAGQMALFTEQGREECTR